jgi:AbrB family looped-hinge helix DNA binding protein
MEIKIHRRLDRLGRLVIPIDLRRLYGLKQGDRVCLTAQDNGILIDVKDRTCHDNKEK